jgi:hypothetical protein
MGLKNQVIEELLFTIKRLRKDLAEILIERDEYKYTVDAMQKHVNNTEEQAEQIKRNFSKAIDQYWKKNDCGHYLNYMTSVKNDHGTLDHVCALCELERIKLEIGKAGT